MKPAAFDYAVPKDADAAKNAIRQPLGSAKFVAGNQSLGPMLNLRLVRASGLVDVSRLPDLRLVNEADDAVTIGAAITHAEIEDGEVIDPTDGWMREVASNIAYRAVRNRGTIGGSLCHADPAADWVIVMTTLGAEALIDGPEGQRKVPMSDFITGPFSTVLAEDEILIGIEVAKPSDGAAWGYWKYMRQVGEFAKASAAIYDDPGRNVCRCAIGALGQKPILLGDPNAIISGELTPEDAVLAALPGRHTGDRTLHVTALKRALEIVRGETGE